jgi:hypothetical protein
MSRYVVLKARLPPRNVYFTTKAFKAHKGRAGSSNRRTCRRSSAPYTTEIFNIPIVWELNGRNQDMIPKIWELNSRNQDMIPKI